MTEKDFISVYLDSTKKVVVDKEDIKFLIENVDSYIDFIYEEGYGSQCPMTETNNKLQKIKKKYNIS